MREFVIRSIIDKPIIVIERGGEILCFLFGYADKDLNADLYRGIFEQIKRYQDFADKFKQKLLSDLSIGLYLKSACSY